MDRISDNYTWQRHMRKKLRWGSGRPEIVVVRGAELTRVSPSEVKPYSERVKEKETQGQTTG